MLNIGNVCFDVISIVIIVLLILSVFIGLKKGLIASLLSFSCGFLTFICATLLTKPLTNLLVSWGWAETMQTRIMDGLFSQNKDLFSVIITDSNKETLVQEGLKAVNLPSFLSSPIISLMNPYIGTNTKFGFALSYGLSYYAFMAICFLALLVIFGIIFIVLKRIAKAFNKVPVLGPINRILGAILMVALCYLIIDSLLFGLSNLLMLNVEWLDGVSGWMSYTLNLNNDNVFSLSKFMYTNSLTSKIINLFVK